MKGQPWGLRKLWTEFPRLSVVNRLLGQTVKSPTMAGTKYQMVVPSLLVPEVLQHLHGGPVAAHFSADRVWERARQIYYWPCSEIFSSGVSSASPVKSTGPRCPSLEHL